MNLRRKQFPVSRQSSEYTHGEFGGDPVQDFVGQNDYDQSATPHLEIEETASGPRYSDGSLLPDHVRDAYELVKRAGQNGQQPGSGYDSRGQYGDGGYAPQPGGAGQYDGSQPTQAPNSEFPTHVRVTIGRKITYEGLVDDHRYLGVASQAVA